ncbi:oxygenase MpaB family protein [Mycolicibacterium thermoresistibile]
MAAAVQQVQPAGDYGFFGPDSVTWKVWSYPTSFSIGFIRSVVIEELDPALVAAVDTTHDIYRRPRTRYDRTLRYFAMVAFGDSRSTSQAADVLVKVHSKAIGTEPYSGQRYDANDPHSQLWIHLTAWHSILYAYEKFGPGPLSEQEEQQYWAECAVAAELQTCDPADVPRDRDGIRQYFEQMRPQLSGSPIARKAMAHLLDGTALVAPDLPRLFAPLTWVTNRVVRAGVLATMPRWMRLLGGLKQSRCTDVAVTPLLRVSFAVLNASPATVKLRLLKLISPSTVPVVAPVFYAVAPLRTEVLTPAQARDRYGYDKPAEAHLQWRAKQHQRVFQDQVEPSDAGLLESQAILGALG